MDTSRIRSLLIGLLLITTIASAQDKYRYVVDLTKVENDRLSVTLTPPGIKKKKITFYMPGIAPGNYRMGNYGKFVHGLKALNAAGKALPVKKLSENSWEISNADALRAIHYQVEDTWESSIPHDVYDMSGTNFEENKNFVLNTPGIFGYLAGMKQLEFELTIKKPDGFYGATALVPSQSGTNTDLFLLSDADHLYDSPIMYSKPDTATIKLGATEVLIASYSPNKQVTAAAIKDLLSQVMQATKNYLGGKLPVKKYAFIFYFNGEQEPLKRTGALEHNYSSFYALPEIPFNQIAPVLLDIAAHEFFHIITPLTIASKEVKQFDFNQPVFSKHLWLYEGTTEYHSDHVQVFQGLAPPENFLAKLAEKIKNSKTGFDDNLPFTQLSLKSAGEHKDQYDNVYEKGALIAACLDVYLLHLSEGHYDLRNLKHDLSIRFGKDKFFDDDKLFDLITELTYPEVRDFFTRYVEGPESIPYEKFFAYAGVAYTSSKISSLGGVQFVPNNDGEIVAVDISHRNAMGEQMGYQAGDIVETINGEIVRAGNFMQILTTYRKSVKGGDPVEVVVKRKVGDVFKSVTLKGTALAQEVYDLKLIPSPSPGQLMVRSRWLGLDHQKGIEPKVIPASPKDAGTIDQIVNALYDVISGPAGPRDWSRFQSLFYPDAYMGAMVPGEGGKLQMKKFSPLEYVKSNGPLFEKFDFFEKEIGRTVNEYGTIAQVFTTYEFTIGTPQPQTERGINSVELVYENDRWWIMSITWNDESSGIPIPAKYKKVVK